MQLKTLKHTDIRGKTILYRAPYDIDVAEKNGVLEVKDDLRIRATLSTLRYLIEQECKIIILTYVKRPDGQVVEKLRTTPHARTLSALLNHPVDKIDECVGPNVLKRIEKMKAGDILMLENVRFYKGEMEDDDDFAQKLCQGKDLIVFDGFPQAMREHASTTGILRHLPSVAGFYLEEEVTTLTGMLDNPKRPFTVIIGGAKISDKVDAVNNLLAKADQVLVGGAVANVFLKAKGYEMSNSFMEDVFVDEKRRTKQDWVEYAKNIYIQYPNKIFCPADMTVSNGTEIKIINIEEEGVPPGWAALDLGPRTCENYSKIISNSAIVFLGGPMGKFEEEEFAEGSKKILSAMQKLSQNNGTSIIGGGDSIDVARRYFNLEDFSHISLAGGATLEFLAGKTLPALVPLIAPR